MTFASLRGGIGLLSLLCLAAPIVAGDTALAKPQPQPAEQAPSAPAKKRTRTPRPKRSAPRPPARTPSELDIPAWLGPAEGIISAGLQLGPAVDINRAPDQFKLALEVAWHPLSEDGTGLAVGVTSAFSFGESRFVWALTPQVSWFFQPINNLGFHVAPFLRLGVAVITARGAPAMTWGFGAQARLFFNGTFYVVMQPIAIELFHDGGGSAARFDVSVGGGMIF